MLSNRNRSQQMLTWMERKGFPSYWFGLWCFISDSKGKVVKHSFLWIFWETQYRGKWLTYISHFLIGWFWIFWWLMVKLQTNNVGTNISKLVSEYTAEDVSFLMSTNFESAYNVSVLAHPLLKASGAGSIVFISSIASIIPLRTTAIYGAAKGN